jgi:voltage-gated potassium channel
MGWNELLGIDNSDERTEEEVLRDERWELLEHVNRLSQEPLTALAFVWLLLLIIDFTRGLSPLLQTLSYVIWGLFIVDFAIEWLIAPSKRTYLRRNWLTALSLVLPAARVLRVFRSLRVLRAVRTIRTVGLLRVITSLNRSMRAAAAFLGQRGLGYMVAITVIVLFGGAAGMLVLESPASLGPDAGAAAEVETSLQSYGEAVWWTATVMTTLGPEYWPRSAEGRILGLLLAVYALAVFGYITANIATYFLGRAATEGAAHQAALASENAALHAELNAVREEVAGLAALLRARDDDGAT